MIEYKWIPTKEFLIFAGQSFVAHPILPCVIILLFFIVVLKAGKSFGIPDLVFQENIRARILHGFIASAVLSQVVLATLLITFKDLRYDPRFQFTEPYLMLWLLLIGFGSAIVVHSTFAIWDMIREKLSPSTIDGNLGASWNRKRSYALFASGSVGTKSLARSRLLYFSFPIGLLLGLIIAVCEVAQTSLARQHLILGALKRTPLEPQWPSETRNPRNDHVARSAKSLNEKRSRCYLTATRLVRYPRILA